MNVLKRFMTLLAHFPSEPHPIYHIPCAAFHASVQRLAFFRPGASAQLPPLRRSLFTARYRPAVPCGWTMVDVRWCVRRSSSRRGRITAPQRRCQSRQHRTRVRLLSGRVRLQFACPLLEMAAASGG